MSPGPNDSGRDLFDVLDDLGVDLDDPRYAGMDAFDVADALGIDLDDEEADQ